MNLLIISKAARERIESWLAQPDFQGHVPCIEWMGDAQGEDWQWMVGTFSADQVDKGNIVIVDGMKFSIRPELRTRLDGTVLDTDGKYFTFRKSAR
jgi:hypothetical protein